LLFPFASSRRMEIRLRGFSENFCVKPSPPCDCGRRSSPPCETHGDSTSICAADAPLDMSSTRYGASRSICVAFWQRERKFICGAIDSRCRRQQKENICLPTNVLFLFIQAAGLVYHRRAKRGVYHQPFGLYIITEGVFLCDLMIYKTSF